MLILFALLLLALFLLKKIDAAQAIILFIVGLIVLALLGYARVGF